MRRLALWVAKGGTGKTTAAVNLAAALAERGRRVLLVDLDPQASATRSLGAEPAAGLLGALLAKQDLAELVKPSPVEGLDLVPASAELSAAERELATRAEPQAAVAEAFARLPSGRWRWLVVDCPPGVGLLSVGALVAADLHVCTVDPSPLSVAGLSDALGLADSIRERFNARLKPSRVLLSRVPRTRAARLTSEGLRGALGRRVLQAEIPERAAVVESVAARLPVTLYAPAHPAALAFRALAEEVDP